MVEAVDYRWAVEADVLGLDLCLTLVRGLTPDEVITRLGGADPVTITSTGDALGAAAAVREWVDENGGAQPSGLDYVAVTPAGQWTMIIEPDGFLCTHDEAIRVLSMAGELVSFSYSEHASPSFCWAVGGRTVVELNPAHPPDRYGDEPGRLDAQLAELGFLLDPADDFDEQFRERTFALMERVTGVHWDAGFLQNAIFRCAAVGAGAAAQPWYAEVRDEVVAFADDPQEWLDDDFDRWSERGVTDRRIKALGSAGTRLFTEDHELAMMIAYAPAELIERMTRWAWERPLRMAGILDEPWFAPIRDRVLRGEHPPPEDIRLVENHLDPYLHTVMPPWLRDDEGQRRNNARALVLPWDSQGPAADLCWTFVRAEGGGGGTWPEIFADLRRDFPELAQVDIPPPPPAPVERAAQRRKREARERQNEQWRVADLQRTWGGRIPDDRRLLEPEVQMYALGLIPHDRDLIDQIARAGPQTQRAMAVWAARQCCIRSGLIEQDWARAGVTALEAGDPPPPWFADFEAAFARWQGVRREDLVSTMSVSLGGDPDRSPPSIEPTIIAIHAVVMARHDNPLIAAIDTVRNAATLDEPSQVVAAFRAAFNLAP